MKKWIFLFIVAAALVFNHYWNTYAEETQVCPNCTTEVTSNFCPDCGESNLILLPELKETEGYLSLTVTYEKNKVLAKYDVDIYVDDAPVPVATLRHNQTMQKIITLEQGLHEIAVKAGNHSSRTMVNVTAKTNLSFSIKTHLFSIDIKNVQTNGAVSLTEQWDYEREQFIAGCRPIDYEQFARYPEEYQNEQVVLQGKVISTAENFAGVMKAVVKDNRGNLWIIQYTRTLVAADRGKLVPRILVNDEVKIYGKCQGITTYTSSVDIYPLLPTVNVMYLVIN